MSVFPLMPLVSNMINPSEMLYLGSQDPSDIQVGDLIVLMQKAHDVTAISGYTTALYIAYRGEEIRVSLKVAEASDVGTTVGPNPYRRDLIRNLEGHPLTFEMSTINDYSTYDLTHLKKPLYGIGVTTRYDIDPPSGLEVVGAREGPPTYWFNQTNHVGDDVSCRMYFWDTFPDIADINSTNSYAYERRVVFVSRQ